MMKNSFLCFLGAAAILAAQEPNPTQSVTQPEYRDGMPLYRVTVVSRTIPAVNYRYRGGATKIDFQGTALLPKANGEAKVEGKKGYTEIEVEFDELQPASKFGAEFLTYVLWAITPEGRANNLGELILSGNRGKLNVTTELQAFGLMVTAEPYFAVTQPSDVVVIENAIRPDTSGKTEAVQAKYELLKRGQYTMNAGSDLRPVALKLDEAPLALYQARHAVQIARWTGADRYAAETFQKAETLLRQAEDYRARKAGEKPVAMTARQAVQTAEDARLIALRRQEEERVAAERKAAADRESAARAQAEQADAERLGAEAERRAAEQATADAQRLKQEAEAARAAAEAEKRAAISEADRARQTAQEAGRMLQQAEDERAQLRRRLLEQFNTILETRDSARGLIVNMSDVLFDVNQATLKPGAREKLAKIAGILLAHPGLKLEIEGHTDSTGSDSYNQQLSERRSDSVRDYLTQQGLNATNISARGLGEAQPVASNDTSSGRQQNRRVEIVVSGDLIADRVNSMR